MTAPFVETVIVKTRSDIPKEVILCDRNGDELARLPAVSITKEWKVVDVPTVSFKMHGARVVFDEA